MPGTEHRVPERWTFRLSAPHRLISQPTDQCLLAHRSLLSFTEPDARNGLSLTRNGCPLTKASIPGSMFPACYFASPPIGCHIRSALSSTPSTGLHRFRALHRIEPVMLSPTGSTSRLPCLHSPSGLLHPFGSKRSASSATSRLTFRIRPIPSRSPRPVLFLDLATDHRSWVATFPEASCSSNLLEPSSLCSQLLFPSILFGYPNTLFPQTLFGLFLSGYSGPPVHLLWIKRGPRILFLR